MSLVFTHSVNLCILLRGLIQFEFNVIGKVEVMCAVLLFVLCVFLFLISSITAFVKCYFLMYHFNYLASFIIIALCSCLLTQERKEL